jgi:hypothetical protein
VLLVLLVLVLMLLLLLLLLLLLFASIEACGFLLQSYGFLPANPRQRGMCHAYGICAACMQ